MLVGTHIRILHNVLGFEIVAKNSSGRAVQPLVVAAHNDLERCRVTVENARNYFFIGPGFGTGEFEDAANAHDQSYANRARERQTVTTDSIGPAHFLLNRMGEFLDL